MYTELTELKRQGAVSFFTCGQGNLESVFLKYAKMSDKNAYLLDEDEDEDDGGSDGDDDEESGERQGLREWQTSKSRLVLEGNIEKYCTGCPCIPIGRCGGFLMSKELQEKEWFSTVPQHLAEKGVTQEEWKERMEQLAAVQRHASDCDCLRAIICCYMTLVIAGSIGWLCLCCPWSACDPFQTKMKKWLDDFNRSLEPKGVYVKAFSHGKRTSGVAVAKDQHNIAMLVFGLTPKEIRRLKAEPVLQIPVETKDHGCWKCPAHARRVI